MNFFYKKKKTKIRWLAGGRGEGGYDIPITTHLYNFSCLLITKTGGGGHQESPPLPSLNGRVIALFSLFITIYSYHVCEAIPGCFVVLVRNCLASALDYIYPWSWPSLPLSPRGREGKRSGRDFGRLRIRLGQAVGRHLGAESVGSHGSLCFTLI